MLSLFTTFLSRSAWLKRLLLSLGIIVAGVSLGLWQTKQPILSPAVSFTTIAGDKQSLAALRGKPVLVTFWATDCASCVREIPHLTELYQRFHPQGLEIFAVAMYYDLPSHVVEMTHQKQIPYPVVLDLKGDHARQFQQVQLTPTTFLIAPNGLIASYTIGALKITELSHQIQQYL